MLGNKVRTFLPILLTFFLLIFHEPICAYYKWYDENGVVHYTQADPPADAKNEDGSSWWEEEPDPEEEKSLREQKLQQIQEKIKNRDARKPRPSAKPTQLVDENFSKKPEEKESVDLAQKLEMEVPEDNGNKGFSIPSLPSLGIFKFWDSTRVDTGEATGPLYGVWGSSKNDVFVVGCGESIPTGNNYYRIRGGIFHYDGSKWSEMSSFDDEFLEGINLHAVWGSSRNDVYAVGSGWTMLHYDGIEWCQIESGLYGDEAPNHGFWGIWGSSANDIYAVGGSTEQKGVVLHFNGEYWRRIALPDTNFDRYSGVWGTSENDVFILGDLGRVYHYNGSSWNEMNIGQPVNLRAIWGASENNVFAVGFEGKIFHYDGEQWSEIVEFKGMNFHGIWGSSGKNIYAAGTQSYNEGAIYHYNGTKWKKIKTVRDYLNGIWGSSAGDIFAVGTGNLILRYSGMSIFSLGIGLSLFGLVVFRRRILRKLRK